MTTRREFVQKAALGTAGITLGAKSYSRILGANDRIRVGIVGYSDRFRSALSPAFLSLAEELNFEFTAISDLWSLRREGAYVVAGYNHSIACIMCTAALRTGEKASFDEANQEVLAGGKVFQY